MMHTVQVDGWSRVQEYYMAAWSCYHNNCALWCGFCYCFPFSIAHTKSPRQLLISTGSSPHIRLLYGIKIIYYTVCSFTCAGRYSSGWVRDRIWICIHGIVCYQNRKLILISQVQYLFLVVSVSFRRHWKWRAVIYRINIKQTYL